MGPTARRMQLPLWLVLPALELGLGGSARAQTISAELMAGTAINFPTPLIVHQNGQPSIDTTAHYDTRPFGPDLPYFAARLSRWDGDRAWEFAEIHHRLFLAHPPSEIQYFAIHFGYNYLFLGRGWRKDGYAFHLGAGPILTNPETVVRNEHRTTGNWFFDGGYYYSGIGLEAAAERDVRISTKTYLVFELALVTGFAWDVPVANGRAEVPNVGLHFHVGLGHDF